MLDIKKIEAAINQIAAEKKIDRERLVEIIESAIKTAYKKDFSNKDTSVNVHLDLEGGKIEVSIEKTVVQEVEDPDTEISFADLGDDASNFEEGDIIEIDVTDEVVNSEGFGRIASQAARQVIVQRIQETEKEKVSALFKSRVGTVVSARVEMAEKGRIIFDYNGHQVSLPKSEQVSRDRYVPGQRMHLYVKAVSDDGAGGQVVLTRRDADFVTALFALGVPELEDNTVEVVSIARNPGFKTKIIVGSQYEEVDPAGCLIGPRGSRVRVVVDELFGEKVDVINYDRDPREVIKAALAPGKIERVEISEDGQTAYCFVFESEKAKVIGKSGANINLASDLTGYRLVIEALPDPEGYVPEDSRPKENREGRENREDRGGKDRE